MSQSLLPSNATPLERALDDVLARPDLIPVPLRELWQPHGIDDDLLPWLAWALSVDYWRADWPLEVKRSVVAGAHSYHRRKGTLAGLRQLIVLMGGDVRRVILPPSRAMLGPEWTPENRRAWEQRHPEMRLYRNRVRGKRAGMMPVGASFTGAKTFLGGGVWYGTAFPARTDALRRTLPRVYRVAQDGTETELTTAVIRRGTATTTVVRDTESAARRGRTLQDGETETIYRIAGRALRGEGAMFPDATATDAPMSSRFFLSAGPRRYLTDQRAYKRVYVTRLADAVDMPDADPTLARAAVQPLLARTRAGVGVQLDTDDPLTTKAETVAQPGTVKGAFHGTIYPGALGAAVGHIVDHYPGSRMYASTRLFDPTVPTPQQSGQFFCGATRLGMPAYNAEIRVAYRRRRNSQRFWRYVRGYFAEQPPLLDRDMLAALSAAKPARDKVLLDTATYGPVTSGAIRMAGDVTAGEWRHLND